MARPTVVLVHGAWHGGWCYRDTARLLRAARHEVFTPTLSGVGERFHAARIAAKTSRGHRRRFSRLPPYSSARMFDFGLMKEDIR